MKITVYCHRCGTGTETELVPMKNPGFYYYETRCRSCGEDLESVLKEEVQQGAGE